MGLSPSLSLSLKRFVATLFQPFHSLPDPLLSQITDFIENTLGKLRTSIQDDVTSVNSAIKTAIDAINKVNPFADINAPQFNIPSLDGLQNVQLPDDFTQALIKLNSSIPSAAEIKDKLNAV